MDEKQELRLGNMLGLALRLFAIACKAIPCSQALEKEGVKEKEKTIKTTQYTENSLLKSESLIKNEKRPKEKTKTDLITENTTKHGVWRSASFFPFWGLSDLV